MSQGMVHFYMFFILKWCFLLKYSGLIWKWFYSYNWQYYFIVKFSYHSISYFKIIFLDKKKISTNIHINKYANFINGLDNVYMFYCSLYNIIFGANFLYRSVLVVFIYNLIKMLYAAATFEGSFLSHRVQLYTLIN